MQSSTKIAAIFCLCNENYSVLLKLKVFSSVGEEDLVGAEIWPLCVSTE